MKTNDINNNPGKGAALFPELAPCPPAGGAGERRRAPCPAIRGLWRRAAGSCLNLSRALPLMETAGVAVLLMVLLGAA